MIVNIRSTEAFAKRESGKKAFNLYIMSRDGLPVPEWVVLGVSCFRQFKRLSEIEHLIEKSLALINDSSVPNSLIDKVSCGIRELILATPFPAQIEKTILDAYQSLNSLSVSIRSSASAEDVEEFSFAGQYSNFLYVQNTVDVLRCVKECWASAYNPNVLQYRIQREMSLHSSFIDIAIIFQEMIDSEKSGVLFTCDPITTDNSNITINALYGVGEGLAKGKLDADTYTIHKESGKIISIDIVSKMFQFKKKDPEGGVKEIPVQDKKQTIPCLSNSEIITISELGKKIEHIFHFPQDIEWGWTRDHGFSIFQTRPVMNAVSATEGKLHIWDNSNMIDCYGGLTLPLTFGFAHYLYHQVYLQLCQVVCLSGKRIRQMKPNLENLLGFIFGRVYYNMLNWYKVTSTTLPELCRRKILVDFMMGTSLPLSDSFFDRMKIKKSRNFLSFFSALPIISKLIYFYIMNNKIIRNFETRFDSLYNDLTKHSFTRIPADKIFGAFLEIEKKLILRWKIPILNDLLATLLQGIIKFFTKKWISSNSQTLINDLLAGFGTIDSTGPTKELINLANYVREKPDLLILLSVTEPDDCFEALQQSSFTEFSSKISLYIEKYGHQCINEMHLEQKDLKMDPSFLFACIKNYLKMNNRDIQLIDAKETTKRINAEIFFSKEFMGIKKYVFFYLLKKTRSVLNNKEKLRLIRSRMYGMIRAMFYGIGCDYASRKFIAKPEDIFYLDYTELSGSLNGTLTCQDLRSLIDLRKNQYSIYKQIDPPSRIITHGPVYWLNKFDEHTDIEHINTTILKGTGASAGVVEGVVRILDDSSKSLELNGEILVASRTDPGLIPLYPTIKGLLIENGSTLSHSAIVAREMNLPAVIGVNNLTKKLRNGMKVRIDGKLGKIEILEDIESRYTLKTYSFDSNNAYAYQ